MCQLWSLGVRAAVLQSISTAAGKTYNLEIYWTQKSWKKQSCSTHSTIVAGKELPGRGELSPKCDFVCDEAGHYVGRHSFVWMASCLLFLWFLLVSAVEAGWEKFGKHRSHHVGLEDLLLCWWWVSAHLIQFPQYALLSAAKPRRCYKAPSGNMMSFPAYICFERIKNDIISQTWPFKVESVTEAYTVLPMA